MRNLTKTLAVMSLLAPVSGYSLGIGDIKLRSALNQNLDAEIALVLSAGESPSDIKVSLAPLDKFSEAGVPWATFLSKIKFTTVSSTNKSVVVRLTSRDAVKEPFLDFLLEVKWPKGSLYREFTVLLDPPAAYQPATIPVFTPTTETAQAELRQVTPTRPTKAQPQTALSDATEYGPTRRNDTLWRVAERAKQAGVSVEQMMVAMYEANPDAFYQQNVHALLTGKTLKIPTQDAILKYSKKQALAEYQKQTKAWKNRLEPAPLATTTAAKTQTGGPDNQLTLVAPTEASVTDNTVVTPTVVQDNTKPSAASPAVSTSTPPTTATPAPATLPASDALQTKITELEKQLALMQQVLALKDQQLAILQGQGQAKAPAVAPTPSTQTPVAQKPPVQASAPVPATPVAPPAAPTVSEGVDYFLLGGGASAVVLGLLGFLWWRKRTQARSGMYADDFEDIPDFFASAIESNAAKGSDTIGASSFFSDFTFGDFDTFDTDQGEIDPVSEADVYLAYGRYQQAEELMRDVIKGQPNRDDFKLKLLEIFYTNENKPAFEAYAQQLADAGKKEDFDFWSKVTEMGSEICPGSTLFNTEIDRFYPSHKVSLDKLDKEQITQPKIKPDTENEILVAEQNAIESNPSETEAADSGRKASGTTSIESSTNTTKHFMGIDLSSFEESFDESKNNDSIDFDLNSDLPDELLESFFSRPQDSAVTDEFESFEFDFSIGDNENGLSALDQNEQKQNELLSNERPNSTSGNFANDVLAGNYYFDKKATGTERHYFDNLTGLEIFDLTDMDELETKLDLAIAYRDISDNDAAKDIVKEVIKKGTTEQKKVAQALLNDLQ